MRIKITAILILFLLFLCGCQLNDNSVDNRQVNVTEFAVPNSGDFSPIFFKGQDVLAQQGHTGAGNEISLYSSNDLKDYKRIALFKNHYGQFYVNPRNSKEIFLVSYNGTKGIFKSVDQGQSWQQIYDDSADYLVFHPAKGNELFLEKSDRTQGLEIIHSTDSGIHWSKIILAKEIEAGYYQFIIDPMNPKHFLIPARTGLWESWDGGSSWERIYQESETTKVIFDPVESNKAYFVDGYSIFSLRNGKIKKINIPNYSRELMDGTGIAIQPTTNKIFVMVTTRISDKDGYNHTIYQLNNEMPRLITTIKSKDRILENLQFDCTNPNVIYVYSYKNIYKINL